MPLVIPAQAGTQDHYPTGGRRVAGAQPAKVQTLGPGFRRDDEL
jgi:hypothetical protein